MGDGLLAPYRVLDLTDGPAELATFMLAGLGADVIKVEPPGGTASRGSAPLAADEPAGMQSLAFHAWNRGKRSVEIDLDTDDGRRDFEALVASAHFLFEDAGAGSMEARGLGFDALRARRPDLVYVSISPFGQDGPHAGHLATDLTLAAMGGAAALNGDADRRPVRVTVPQTWLHGSAESALAAIAAHHRRLTTGDAQHVDMAVQTAVFWTGLNAMIKSAIDGTDAERCGTTLSLSTTTSPLVYPCADGEVCLIPIGATLIGLIPWMLDAGIVDADWVALEEWETYERRRLDGSELAIEDEEVRGKVAEFVLSLTKQELFAGALERGVTVMPVNTTEDTLAMEHLQVREYWDDVELPSGRTVRMPGRFVNVSNAPISWSEPAPEVGQHTREVLDALGPEVPPVRVIGERSLPLEGIKVADFSWIGVGPITAKSLADHGATVVRIESDDPPDRLRLVGPFTDGELGINRCQFFGSFNTSKKSLHLNLKHPQGNEIATRLLEWCDIAIDSFTAGTMGRLGLGYEDARAINPSIIMAETCLFGQTGPAAQLAGYGYHAAAISGFYEVTGWPDRAPGGPWNAYTDTIAPRFLTTVLLSALDHRERTGEGQYIDQAQMESALHFLGPQLLDSQISGTLARRNGNVDLHCAPHDTYPCAGDDQWIAIAVESDEQWRNLVAAMGASALAEDDELATANGRRANLAAIDDAIAAWTRGHQPHALMTTLQEAGVPAGVVQRSSDHLRDPQLLHRGFFRPMQHPEMGEVPYEGHQYRISGYDNGPRTPAPCLGEHTFEVLTDLLGLDADYAIEALGSGACG